MGKMVGRAVVVTGGASGIGESTARMIVAEGGMVVIADIQDELGQNLAEELGSSACFAHTDVTSEDDIEAAVATAVSEFGGLWGMVTNAGVIGAIGSIMDTPVENYDRTMAILARGVFLGIKHAAKAMRDSGGSIVSLASTAGVVGGLGPHVYTMAKHGVVGLTKSAASELAALGIRVNAVAPGSTATPMVASLADNDMERTQKMIAEASPLGVSAVPEDIANAIVYLLSDEGRYVSGHTLVVDAGETTAGSVPQFHGAPAGML